MWFFRFLNKKKNKKEKSRLLLNAIIDICNKDSIKNIRLNKKDLGDVFYDFSQEVTEYKLVNEEELHDLLITLYEAKINEIKYKEVLIERK
jgi:hypothetical protein